MMLLQMPDHILTRIFGSLKVKDRLNLTLVCRQLNQHFGNEKELMKNILVSYVSPDIEPEGERIENKRFLDSMVGSSRKYRNFQFDFQLSFEANGFEHFLPLTKFESLTELEIENTCIELEPLAMLVNNLPNLEVFVTTLHLKNTKNSTEKLSCKKLKKLEASFDIFRKMTETPDLIYLKFFFSESDVEEVRQKIVNLDKLKYLDFDVHIFNEEFTQNAKFKLTEIGVCHVDWTNTIKFLKTQGELQKVTVYFTECMIELKRVRQIIETLLILPTLKNLVLNVNSFADQTPEIDQTFNVSVNTNIETLDLKIPDKMNRESETVYKFIEKLISKLPNLKKFDLNVENGIFYEELVNFNTLKDLEMLSISASDCALSYLCLPKLKEFSLTAGYHENCGYLECSDVDLLQFFLNHPNLKKVEISMEKLISRDVWTFIKSNLHHLEVLQTKIDYPNGSAYPEEYAYFCSDEDFDVEVDKKEVIVTATRIRFNC